MAISFIIIAFVLFGGLDYLLNLFSLNGMDGGSTAARLLTIDHYWSLIKEKDAILGVGFLSAYTNKAFSILRRSDTDRFWLEVWVEFLHLGSYRFYYTENCFLIQ